MSSNEGRSFVERIGGVLVAPKGAAQATLSEPVGRGALDVLALLFLRLVAGELPLLVRALADALSAVRHGGATFAVANELVTTLMHVGAGALSDVIAILLGAMALTLLGGGGAKAASSRGLDLAAYAWLPCVSVQLVATIVCALAGVAPSDGVQLAVAVVGMSWSLVAWTLALVVVRASRAQSATTEVAHANGS